MTIRTAAGALLIIAALTGLADAAQRSAKDQALFEKARAACSGPQWPSGARPFINYAGGWFRCDEPRSR